MIRQGLEHFAVEQVTIPFAKNIVVKVLKYTAIENIYDIYET